jgi:hypothetical protein
MTKTPSQLQLNDQGELTHLLTLEGLSKEHILHILDTAQQFVSVSDADREVKKYRFSEVKTFLTSSLKILRAPERRLRLLLSAYLRMW